MVALKEPMQVAQVFAPQRLQSLKDLLQEPKRFYFDPGFSRYTVADNSIPTLQEFAHELVPLARELFGSDALLPTYTLFAHYEGDNPAPSLYRHKDDNACTYTIDMCVYQTEPWDLYVEGKAYTLQPNEALAYFGNEQEHWREQFPNPGKQHVAMIFFHFAEPDHWFFTKGPRYLSVIRGEMSEQQYAELHG